MSTIQDIYELSPMQQGMLFHTIYAPETGIYFEQRHCLLEGTLDARAFRQAWQQVCDRYDVLRTEFHWQETDKPLQVVYDKAELPWIEDSWQTLSTAGQNKKLDAFLLAQRLQGFQLDQGPLMRCALFQLSDHTYRFVWSYHHLLMDGWCNGVLIKEVLAFYQAIHQGKQCSLPPVKPYRDYIVWLQQQESASAEAYWRKALEGFKAPTALGIARIQSATTSAEATHHEQQAFLTPALSKGLQTFAKQSRLTLNTLLQGAWAVALSRYSGLEDVLFGITVSGRPPELSGVASMVGLFINTVPLRVSLSASETVLPWLQGLQQAQRDRETYSYSLLTDVQSWSDVPSGTPLFESLLVFENYPISIEAATDSLEVGFSLRDGQGYEKTNYPLTLVVIPGETIQLSLRYDSQRISNEAAIRLLGHLQIILESFIQEPEHPVSQVSLLTDTEQRQLNEIARGKVFDISPECIHQQFEQQAANTPDTSAITFSGNQFETGETLTYQQLNQQANRIAHYLSLQGITTGTRVGLCLERSTDMVASLLAVLKVGGIYVPLDPSHPAKRSHYIIEDAQIELLITTKRIAEQSLVATTASTLCLDEKADLIRLQSTNNISSTTPLELTQSESIAYILYTSGSTGQPKGVPICHRSLTNFLASMAQISRITAQDTLLAVTTLGFDIAALEIFLPLVTGAHLVMTAREITLDGEQLANHLADYNVTLMQATPATWRLLLNAGWKGSSRLKILCGGEALDVALAQQLLSCGCELWNLYGPTETTIWSGALRLDDQTLTQGIVPIGAPIANTQFYVLDAQQRQVPVGVAGELYIGGAGLSEGYWNRPKLTAERFVDVEWLSSRLYKTGDRVRYRDDGMLDYLGRLDNQIKLRGFRIELGAIETKLTQHSSVTQAVVIVSEGNNPQLLAYLSVIEKNTEALIDKLRRRLSQQLPAYMVPSSYHVLESFPLTPNGKVDRRSLPTFHESALVTQPPQTPNEKLIAGIWAEILGLETINLNDNFFDLGGHSLLATRVISQVRQVFDVEVALRSLFEHPRLSDFVFILQQSQSQAKNAQSFPSITHTDQLVLSYAQQRQWLMTQLDPDSAAYNIPIAVKIRGELSIEGLRYSLAQVVNRHDTLRTVYPSIDGKAVPKVLTAEASLSVVNLDHVVNLNHLDVKAQRLELENIIQQQAEQSFDLEQGPLWRSHLIQLGAHEHILLITLHHIVTDGWSMGVLIKELTAFYQAHQSGRKLADVLDPLPISYGDYAAWQKSLDFSPQLTYWKQQLSGVAPLISLPTDYARPSEPTQAGGSYEFRLSQSETESLQRFSQQNKVTLFMTLLAAFKALLYRYSGQDSSDQDSGICDLAIGTPIANRQRRELEGLIGLFVNTLVIRTQVESNPRFSDFLTQVRSTTLEAYTYQDLPFEQLVDALEIPRSRSHTPLVQVMFALQNGPLEATSLTGLESTSLDWTPLSINRNTAKFDLSLDIKETEKGLVGRWEYRADLFSAATIHRMAGHFRRLLKAVPKNGERRLSELPMLSPQEVKQLHIRKKGVSTQPLPTQAIHQLFESQAAATPTAIAVVHKHTQITYEALNQRANQLAHYLRQQGVTKETPIGLWTVQVSNGEATPTSEAIITILAILKAGGTYIPLDPHYPPERLEWMVTDTQMALLVESEPSMTAPLAIPTVTLSAVAAQIATLPIENLSNSVQPASLAYILYTSGSTGRPKGVCVPHQGVTRLVREPNYVTLSPSDVILQAAPLTFDASTFEIWGALLNGSKLVLMSAASPSLEALGQAIATHQVTTLWLTSGLFNLMVDEQLEKLASVRQLIAGGDVLSPSHLTKALETLKNTRIINGYGPTEGTTFTCCHTVTASDLATDLASNSPSTVPIGYPLQHTQIYVLDADLQQVPAGIPGELYIGGVGVARGYLNRPELTAEKFIPNPFYDIRQRSDSDSFYLYKTGDRVRYRTDGALEYLGRLDQQVKIRGFRIEPGEIESALASHPDIRQVAVVVHGNAAEQKRLVAYVAAVAETIEPLAIKQFLREKLPDYMVPAKVEWLKALPLTANGKVDKRALPEPQWGAPQNQESAPNSQTAIEKTLIDIFSTLLPAKSVGIYDNFFELGGDSIIAMQIVSRAAQSGLTLSPKQLFQYQTVAELARVAEEGSRTSVSQSLATGNVSLTPIQHWFFEQSLAEPQHFNQSVTLTLPDGFDRDALERAIAHLYSHHDALRLRFSSTDNGWQQAFSEEITPPTVHWFEFAQLSLSEQNNAIEQKSKTLQASLNLQAGPLVSVSIFDLGKTQPSQLFIAVHHLVIDGVSWRILLADLQQAYQQALAGGPIQLAAKTHSYQKWAQELAQVARSPEIEADFDYWCAIAKTTAASSPQNTLSQSGKQLNNTIEQNTIEHSQTAITTLSAALTQSLLQEVPSVYNTQITEALLTAFAQTLTQWTEQPTTLINLESYGRFSEKLDLSRTVGWFTALYPALLTFDTTDSLSNNFKSIKSQLRAVPNQGISYGLLRYLRNTAEDSLSEKLETSPDVSFNYLGQLDTIEKGVVEENAFQRVTTTTPNQATANGRPHLLDVNSWIENHQLQVEWTFSSHHHTPDTIHQLSEQFLSNLTALIEHCCEKEEAEYTPDDFGLVQLDASALAAVLGQVSFTDTSTVEREVSR